MRSRITQQSPVAWIWLLLAGVCSGSEVVLNLGAASTEGVQADCIKHVPVSPKVLSSEYCYKYCKNMEQCKRYSLVTAGSAKYCRLTYSGARCDPITYAPTAAPTSPPEFECPEGFGKHRGAQSVDDVCVHYCERHPIWIYGTSSFRGRREVGDKKVLKSLFSSRADYSAFAALGKAGNKPEERTYYCTPEDANMKAEALVPDDSRKWLKWLDLSNTTVFSRVNKSCAASSEHGGASQESGLTVCAKGKEVLSPSTNHDTTLSRAIYPTSCGCGLTGATQMRSLQPGCATPASSQVALVGAVNFTTAWANKCNKVVPSRKPFQATSAVELGSILKAGFKWVKKPTEVSRALNPSGSCQATFRYGRSICDRAPFRYSMGFDNATQSYKVFKAGCGCAGVLAQVRYHGLISKLPDLSARTVRFCTMKFLEADAEMKGNAETMLPWIAEAAGFHRTACLGPPNTWAEMSKQAAEKTKKTVDAAADVTTQAAQRTKAIASVASKSKVAEVVQQTRDAEAEAAEQRENERGYKAFAKTSIRWTPPSRPPLVHSGSFNAAPLERSSSIEAVSDATTATSELGESLSSSAVDAMRKEFALFNTDLEHHTPKVRESLREVEVAAIAAKRADTTQQDLADSISRASEELAANHDLGESPTFVAKYKLEAQRHSRKIIRAHEKARFAQKAATDLNIGIEKTVHQKLVDFSRRTNAARELLRRVNEQSVKQSVKELVATKYQPFRFITLAASGYGNASRATQNRAVNVGVCGKCKEYENVPVGPHAYKKYSLWVQLKGVLKQIDENKASLRGLGIDPLGHLPNNEAALVKAILKARKKTKRSQAKYLRVALDNAQHLVARNQMKLVKLTHPEDDAPKKSDELPTFSSLLQLAVGTSGLAPGDEERNLQRRAAELLARAQDVRQDQKKQELKVALGRDRADDKVATNLQQEKKVLERDKQREIFHEVSTRDELKRMDEVATRKSQSAAVAETATEDAKSDQHAEKQEAENVAELSQAERRVGKEMKEVKQKLLATRTRHVKLCKAWTQCAAWSPGAQVALFADVANSAAWNSLSLGDSVSQNLAWFQRCPTRPTADNCERRMLDWDGLASNPAVSSHIPGLCRAIDIQNMYPVTLGVEFLKQSNYQRFINRAKQGLRAEGWVAGSAILPLFTNGQVDSEGPRRGSVAWALTVTKEQVVRSGYWNSNANTGPFVKCGVCKVSKCFSLAEHADQKFAYYTSNTTGAMCTTEEYCQSKYLGMYPDMRSWQMDHPHERPEPVCVDIIGNLKTNRTISCERHETSQHCQTSVTSHCIHLRYCLKKEGNCVAGEEDGWSPKIYDCSKLSSVSGVTGDDWCQQSLL